MRKARSTFGMDVLATNSDTRWTRLMEGGKTSRRGRVRCSRVGRRVLGACDSGLLMQGESPAVKVEVDAPVFWGIRC